MNASRAPVTPPVIAAFGLIQTGGVATSERATHWGGLFWGGLFSARQSGQDWGTYVHPDGEGHAIAFRVRRSGHLVHTGAPYCADAQL